MPRDLPLTITGTVAAGVDVPLELSGSLAAGGAAELELSGTVSTVIRDAITGRSSAHGVRLVLAGREIPEEDLVGAVEISDEIDSPNTIVRFSVQGLSYSFARTLSTWTHVPVELELLHASPGGDPITLEEFQGYLVPASGRQRGVLDPVLTLTADTISVLGDGTLCAEVEPGAGLSRREITAVITEPLGVTVAAPGGPPYSRGLEVMDQTCLAWLQQWGEAAGLYWRLLPGLILEGYSGDVTAAPQAPDETWTADDCESIDPEPAPRPLSTVVVRGMRTVTDPGTGIEIEIQSVEIRRPYARRGAVAQQLTNGTTVPVSSPSTEAFQPVSRVETETHRKGGLEIANITREYGWDNPKAARLRTPSASEPDGPEDGYYPTEAWIDEEGEYRFFRYERFLLKTERRIRNFHGAAGELERQEIEDFRRRAWTAGVKRITGGVPGPWQVGVGVATDDQSYFVHQVDGDRLRIDDYGLAEKHVVTHRYDETTGAEAGSSQTSDGYYSPRAAVDVDDFYLRYDGSAQVHGVAPFQRFAESDKTNGLTDDGRLSHEVETSRGYHILLKKDGAHDWGGSERSHRVSEVFRTLEAKITLYRRLGDGSAERLELSTSGPPTLERIVEDTIPLPRFAESPWTTLRQEPWEHVEGPTDEDLWGNASIVVENPYLESPEEGRALARRLRRRSLSPRARVRRLETRARPGDTVRLIDPHQGIDHRALVAGRRRRFELTGANVADYDLELEV